MSRFNLSLRVCKIAAVVMVCIPGVLSAADDVLTVTSSDNQGWVRTNLAGIATIGITDTQPYGAGSGSLEFTTDDATDAVNATKFLLQPLGSIEEIGYSYFTDSTATAPVLQIEYGQLLPSQYGTLVYEPVNQGAITPDTWVDVPDASTGDWWNTAVGQETKQTLAEWQAALPDVTVIAVHVRVGSGWSIPSQTFADLVRIYYTGDPKGTTWDFETGTLAEAAAAFHALSPCRIVDTVNALDPAYVGPFIDEKVTFYTKDPDQIEMQGGVAGGCNVPPEATSISMNVTSGKNTAGRLTVYPAGTAEPYSSLLNFSGSNIANNAIIQVCTSSDCTDGDITVSVVGESEIFIDVMGYFAPLP